MRKLLLISVLLISSATYARQFGFSGRHGSDGRDASNGASASDAFIYADGSRKVLDLSGGDAGDNAQDGSYGEDAYSCYQSLENYNLFGANGGQGGDGGDGGRGGNGADATIVYQDISDLSNITLYNQGGRGSAGGYGAEGGRACYCQRYQWRKRYCWWENQCRNQRVCETKKVCRDVPKCRIVNGRRKCTKQRVCENKRVCRDVRKCDKVRRCEDRLYTCRDGYNGRAGHNGSRGSSGSRGSVKLIKGKTLPSQNTSETLNLLQFLDRKVVLSKHIWSTKSGLRSLLAPGSNVGDQYTEYVDTIYNTVTIEWAAGRNVEEFNDTMIDLSFSPSGQAGVKIRSNDLLKTKIERRDNHVHIIIEDAYKLSEINQLSTGFRGRKSRLEIEIHDKSALNLALEHEIYLHLELGQLTGGRTLYKGVVPADKLVITDKKISIKAGEIAKDNGKMRKGRKIRYSLSITRKLGNAQIKVNLKKDKTKVR